MSRAMYTVNNGNGIAISLWADSEREARLRALQHKVSGNAEPHDTESMYLASAAVIICTCLAIALIAVLLPAEHQQREVSCHAPVDTGQKLTVFVVPDGNGGFEERCQYSPIGFGS